ncbi:MAG: hypothetical protein CL678_14565 [Bdellovibrionaceae bacterium]|nr:hypothetical protein [Pseudobdellovibrionaceae bacterium]
MSDYQVTLEAMLLALNAVVGKLRDRVAVNATLLDNVSLEDTVDAVRAGTVSETTLLGGQTSADIKAGITGGSESTVMDVLAAFETQRDRTDNPFEITKEQVGLGNVQNFSRASSAQTLSGSREDLYVALSDVQLTIDTVLGEIIDGSPEAMATLNDISEAIGDDPDFAATLYGLIDAKETPTGAQTKVDDHAARRDNPNQVTKAQVGLGDMLNYAFATTLMAQTGTATDRYMSPVRVEDYLASLGLATNTQYQAVESDITDAFNDFVDSL